MMADWGRTGKATSGLATKSREAHVTEPHCSGFDLVNNRLGLLWDDALYSKGFTVEAHGVFLTSPPAALKSTGAVSPVTTYSYDAVSNLSGYTYQQNSVQTSHTYDPLNRLTNLAVAPVSSPATALTSVNAVAGGQPPDHHPRLHQRESFIRLTSKGNQE